MGHNPLVLRKILFQLKPRETFNYLLYQIQLKTGIFRLRTPIRSKNTDLNNQVFSPNWFPFLSSKDSDIHDNPTNSQVILRADKILKEKIKLFGMIETELNLNPGISLRHWSRPRSKTETARLGDIKFTWEPARFSWGINLAQAFFLSKNEKYADSFWLEYSEFSKHNPLNMGPNWESAQEVALRLIAFIISANLLKGANSSTEERMHGLFFSVADHADRILPTLSYAKAQNNNHLISEAVGLYTAGTFLNNHPNAETWMTVGNKLFQAAIQRQIKDNGEYIQHSTNYRRMMLTLAVWMKMILQINNDTLEIITKQKLRNAVLWLNNLLDRKSGQVPNMGHNDGSLIFPFSTSQYQDYRPVIQASSTTFLRESLLESGNYDDLCNWLGLKLKKLKDNQHNTEFVSTRIGDDASWGILRAIRYDSRPAHADQLHVDIWFKGINILRDAGTYQYNAPHPWDNGLASTQVHNTITIGRKDQMTRASRFLWLDWAQAHISENNPNTITAAHDGYMRQGVVHERKLSQLTATHWRVLDKLYKLKAAKNELVIRQHWLLPDWPTEHSEDGFTLTAPFGKILIKFSIKDREKATSIMLFKAGKAEKSNTGDEPLLGWYSPTYGVKQPATSVVFSTTRKIPVEITTDIFFD